MKKFAMNKWVSTFRLGLAEYWRKDVVSALKDMMYTGLLLFIVGWTGIAAFWVVQGSSAPEWATVLGILFFIALFTFILMAMILYVFRLGRRAKDKDDIEEILARTKEERPNVLWN